MKMFQSEIVDGRERLIFIYHKNWFTINQLTKSGIYHLHIYERDSKPGGKRILTTCLGIHSALAKEFAIHITRGFIYGKYGEWLGER